MPYISVGSSDGQHPKSRKIINFYLIFYLLSLLTKGDAKTNRNSYAVTLSMA